MSVSSVGQIETNVIEDQELNATAELISSGATILFDAIFDNTANSTDTFIHLYDDAAPSVGSDHPAMTIKIPAGKKDGISPIDAVGILFPANLSAAATTAGGKGGTTSPTNKVTATFLTD